MDTFTSTNLKKIFTYPFEDENWQKKLAIAGGLMLASFIIPILPFLALYGYMMKIIKNVVEGDGQPSLPEWDDWGELLPERIETAGRNPHLCPANHCFIYPCLWFHVPSHNPL